MRIMKGEIFYFKSRHSLLGYWGLKTFALKEIFRLKKAAWLTKEEQMRKLSEIQLVICGPQKNEEQTAWSLLKS